MTPGTIIRLAAPKGEFFLPEPLPSKILFVTAGSGITPVMSMLRSLAKRSQMPDVVHIHSAPTLDDVIFRDELERMQSGVDGYHLRLQATRSDGKFDLAALDAHVPDWRERQCWSCGPVTLLDDMEKHYESNGLRGLLHIERFAIARTDHGGEGGTFIFGKSVRTAELDGATTLLEAGEDLGVQMPFGCRMGICQTCVVQLTAGYTRDLRTGEEHREGDRIQTCVSAVAGACTIDL